MQILDCNPNLIWKFFYSHLCKFKVSDLNVIKQIFSLHVFKNNVVVIWIFKKVNKTNNIWMLWHFKNFYFSSLLIDFDWFHIFFVHCLNSSLLCSLFMCCKFNQAKLSFSQIFFKLIIIKKIGITYNFFTVFEPFHLLFITFEIQNSRFVRRKHNLYWK